MNEQNGIQQKQVSPRECIIGVIETLGKIRVAVEDEETIRKPILIARNNLVAYVKWMDEREAEQTKAADAEEPEGCGDVQT